MKNLLTTIFILGSLLFAGTAHAQTFRNNQLVTPPYFGVIMGDGSMFGILTASSAPTFRYLTATSTSATSTLPRLSVTGLLVDWVCFSADVCRTTWPTGGAFPFTPTTNFGVSVNATNTPLWLQAGLQASSTSRLQNSITINATTTNATTTNLYISGQLRYGSDTGCPAVTAGIFSVGPCGGFLNNGLMGQLAYYVNSSTLSGTSSNPLYVGTIFATSTTASSTLQNTSVNQLKISSLNGVLTGNAGFVGATSLSTDQILVGTATGYTTATANTANGWVKTDSNNNITGYTLIPRTSSTTDINSVVLSEGELAVATNTPPNLLTLRVGDGMTAGGIIVNPFDYSTTTQIANYSRGMLGVGTSTAVGSRKFVVLSSGTAAGQRAMSVINPTSGRDLSITLENVADAAHSWGLTRFGSGSFGINYSSSYPFSATETSVPFVISTNNNVGISTSTPNWMLSVAGSGSFDDFARASYFSATSTTASTLPYASTTAITATNASTTVLTVSGAGGAAGCATFSATGVISNTGVACGTGAGGAFPFTPGTYGAQSINSTTTGLRLLGSPYGMIASSTLTDNASTTHFSSVDSTQLATNGTGMVGIRNTTPNSALTIGTTNTAVAGSNFSLGAVDAILHTLATTNGASAGLDVYDRTETRKGVFAFSGAAAALLPASVLVGSIDATNFNLITNSTARMTINGTTGNVGVGTTTPTYSLSVLNTSAPQLALSAGAGVAQWTARNAGGNFYLSTTTVQGTATSSAALSINGSNGRVGVGTANPGSPFNVRTMDGTGIAFQMNGKSRTGAVDEDGVVLVYTFGGFGDTNQQFSLCGKNSGNCLRFLGTGIDGYNYLTDTRQDMSLSTDTTDVTVGRNMSIANRMTTVHASTTGSLSVAGGVTMAGLPLNTGAATASVCMGSINQLTRNTDNETCLASSARYKDNIKKLTEGLEKVLALKTVSFKYKGSDLEHYGLIAEDVEKVDPLLASYDDEGLPNGIRWSHITTLLVQSVQDIIARISGLEDRLDAQEKRIEALEKKLNEKI